VARIKLNKKQTTALETLVKLAKKVYSVADLDLPRDFRLLDTRPRNFSKSFSFGKTYGLMVLISRAYNRPQNKDEKYDFDIQLDNNEDQLKVLKNIDPEIIEEIRESNGYHSFLIKDDNDIGVDIFDCLEPDMDLALTACEDFLKHLKLDCLIEVLKTESASFDISKWDAAEAKALDRANAELKEADDIRMNMKSIKDQL